MGMAWGILIGLSASRAETSYQWVAVISVVVLSVLIPLAIKEMS